MGGSSSSEKGEGERENDESGVEMTTKKTICTTISGGKHRKRAYRKQTQHKRTHSKRRTHSRR